MEICWLYACAESSFRFRATSEPKGPVYLWARREVTEEEVDEATMDSCKKIGRLGVGSVEPMGLSDHGTVQFHSRYIGFIANA